MNLKILLIIIIIFFSGVGIVRPSCIRATQRNNSCSPPNRSTSDPLVFGPILWTAFHMMAAGYHTPNATDPEGIAPEVYRKNAKKFIESLPFMIPCSDCGLHFHNFIKTRNLEEDTRTKTNFIRFFVEAHNNVTHHINTVKVNGKLLPPKKLWTVEDAKNKYPCMDTCISDPRIWTSKKGGLRESIQKYPAEYIN